MEAGIILLLVIGTVFYFLPSAIAAIRQAEHDVAIFAINLLFGWTILGWIAVLVWAVVEKTRSPKQSVR
jgi:hypothetical protein